MILIISPDTVWPWYDRIAARDINKILGEIIDEIIDGIQAPVPVVGMLVTVVVHLNCGTENSSPSVSSQKRVIRHIYPRFSDCLVLNVQESALTTGLWSKIWSWRRGGFHRRGLLDRGRCVGCNWSCRGDERIRRVGYGKQPGWVGRSLCGVAKGEGWKWMRGGRSHNKGVDEMKWGSTYLNIISVSLWDSAGTGRAGWSTE